MASPENNQVWERLQEKSREELLGLLEQTLQKQPEISNLLKLLLELPAASGARAEQKAGVGRVRTLDPATIQAQVQATCAQAGRAWGYSLFIADDLSQLLALGDSFVEDGQWANAQVVYATVAEELLPFYEELEEEDHLAGVLENCIGGLLSCLEAQQELPDEDQLEDADRQALLASLVALWKHGCEHGLEVNDIPEVLARQITADERRWIEAWVQREKTPGETSDNTWLQHHFADFLAFFAER
jgi:hypothetical protein